MNKQYDDLAQKFFSVSRKISAFAVVFFILSFLISGTILLLELKWVWLKVIGEILFALVLLMIIASWTTSGVLFIFGYPNIAFAWFQGEIRSLSHRSWGQLTNGKKYLVIALSIIQLVGTLLGTVTWAINYSKS